MKKNSYLPQDVVSEVVCGWFTFRGSDDEQLNIAEQIAGQRYSSINDLVETIKPYVKNNREFKKGLQELKECKSFDPYWLTK